MKRRKLDPAEATANFAKGVDDRFQAATPLRALLNKVFPDHWSFLLGEIALFSFIVLLLSGVFLTLFFDPTMKEVTYHGSYLGLHGVQMSGAYESSLNLSFEVRGGLFMRQMHHWAALLFMASIVVHMARVFFTGAFRKPREINWVIGVLLFLLGFFAGFTGYSLPDDGLSGTGLRIASAIMLSLPVIGTWLSASIFGGEYPGELIIGRFYIAHVLLIPGILLALISVHLGIVFKQKHTQWPGPMRTNENVVGERMFPRYAMKQGGFFMAVFGVIALMAGLFQINPIWLFGPYLASEVSSASQPDWYVMFMDGLVRLMPNWQIYIPFGDGYSIPPLFWPAVVGLGALFTLPMLYPWLEARKLKDNRSHHLLQRPRDNPERVGIGMMAFTFFLVATISGGNDVIADKFHISLNAMTWAGRIGLLVLPPLAYYVSIRICLGLQQHDREVLAHGVETGIIKRLPNGKFVEIHQPLGPVDEHGHPIPLEYRGWVVPKKMNKIGALAPAVKGFFFPIEKPAEAPVSPAPIGATKREEITTKR
ncbi:menaquinol-cytochrome C reductase cytochrome b subunit [Actinoplanes sp. SE50]|uniref:cytochrome bc1 complex cytochrome b subunit n=1 Tax=unclassified Actinoplanes TaxID=2626549 RepID=UPI00023EC745|nr:MULTISPECIES: ubiquinol-cytochrome c reductase cytochrome b subunit [unclassified Actinoplanes]AEV82548.1 ubiquinol-cytochrome c reductase cytochrome b subunit [Actinoplanes sp. SE50/110]ATO80944.1 menaquinol-cytochrome C reductase cytochrome b subunit [Actinoplanes sp. SE50]SLL98351.1 ubiquinol-cytochrome c reductase, cytochrome b subunit [Actinoplanes sp. SE50/110]